MRFIPNFVFLAALVSGCATTPPPLARPHPTLSPGHYSLIQDFTDVPDKQTEHSETECTVAIDGSSIVITSTLNLGTSLVGSIKDGKILLTVYHENPDPMIRAMEMSIIYEGRIQEEDSAAGRLKGYAGSNMYATGKWTLERISPTTNRREW